MATQSQGARSPTPNAVTTKRFDSRSHPTIRAGGTFVPDGYILLNDIPGASHQAVQKRITEFSRTQQAVFHAVSAQQLTRSMLDQLKNTKALFAEGAIAVVYTGEGAQKVFQFIQEAIRLEPKKYGSLSFLVSDPIFVGARRIPQSRGRFDIRIGKQDIAKFAGAQRVMVVDDVISSGQTMNELKQKIMREVNTELDAARSRLGTRRRGYQGAVAAGNAKWTAAAWLTVEPTKKRPLKAQEAFATIVTARMVRHSSGTIPPINSISTFLRRDAKGKVVRQGYRPNLSRPRAFSTMLAGLRKTRTTRRVIK
ncbi:hypothetical protein KKE06_05075 [Candidatus Micrarchaeota archaeon]|nr:hypothetical protein [Candidatus Micrarchaeota archaeon]